MLMSRYQRRNRNKRIIVVTGASAGVGRAIARELARPGVCLGLIARGLEGLEAAAREVEELGGLALMLPCDVADADAVEAAAAKVEETFGSIDIWINNAMTSVFAPVHEITAAEFARVTQVTYLGYVHGTLAALKRMRERDKGKIIQIGSALSYRGIPLQSAYCAAKHAINGFTDSLRTELMHDKSKISLSIVQLPAINTPQFDQVRSKLPCKAQPVPPIFQPEVAARAVAWACDHDRREVLVGGSTALAIWSNKLVPWLADRKLARDGYDDQQTDEPADRERPDNLFEPIPGDKGAHGRFTERANDKSIQLWASLHRGATAAAVLVALLALTAVGVAIAWAL